jgi:hypothetical protein
MINEEYLREKALAHRYMNGFKKRYNLTVVWKAIPHGDNIRLEVKENVLSTQSR